ncbi:dienelactone hydrolase family protein [Humitalea sp. 24SJ18S-53]|uniref:dienelactone hydrolase family protein n=1 Tax=Humitalea sp. 24SJ18S-53 TaxID=3422307 RepID=UPI003D67B9AA
MPQLTIAATDGSGSFGAYLAEPKTPRGGTVVLIQEIFGVNQAMRALCDWVADMGYFAVAPDLFWRIEPGLDLNDTVEPELARAFQLFGQFDQAKGIEDLTATLAVARKLPGANGRVGTMGFCLGGRLAFRMATGSDADCNISYYGVGLEGLLADVPKISAPLLLHIAEADKFVPPAAQAAILAGVAGNPLIAAHVYPGADHAFARIGSPAWNALAATIANGRTAEMLERCLG